MVTEGASPGSGPSWIRWTPGSAVGLPATTTTVSGPAATTAPTAVNGRSRSVTPPSAPRTATPSNPSRQRASTTRPSSSTAYREVPNAHAGTPMSASMRTTAAMSVPGCQR